MYPHSSLYESYSKITSQCEILTRNSVYLNNVNKIMWIKINNVNKKH